MIEDTNATIVNPSQLGLMALVSAAITFFLVWQMIKQSKTSYTQVYKDDYLPKDELSF